MRNNLNSYSTLKPLDTITAKCNNIIKFTPLKTLDFSNPALEISYERKLSNSFSGQLMASWLFPNSAWDINKDVLPNTTGYRIAFEEKYFFEKSAPQGPYISLELNYMHNKFKDLGYFHAKDDNSDPPYTSYSDTIGIKKQTLSINFKVGYQLIVEHLCIDFYAGFGPRYKDVEQYNRLKPEDVMDVPKPKDFYFNSNLIGKYWTVSIPLNVRIGWIF